MANRFIAFLFVVALLVPLIDMVTGIFPDPVIDENRTLARFPDLSFDKKAFRAFGEDFQAWFDDHLGLRGILVSSFRLISQDLLNIPDKVLKGRDGWLFLYRDNVNYAKQLPLPADLCGRNSFTSQELTRWRDALRDNRRKVEALGARYVVMIVPNKQSIHDDYLPSTIRCQRYPRRLYQLDDALADNKEFPLIRGVEKVFLDAASTGQQLWFKTDTHWDASGAALGARLTVDTIATWLGRSLPDPLSDGTLKIVDTQSSGWGLARMLGSVKRYREDATRLDSTAARATSKGNALPGYARGPLRPTERFVQSRQDLPTVLALHDSFFGARFKTVFAESFRRADFVWHGGTPILGRELDLIRILKPDVVVHEMVERNLLHPYFATDNR
ncbi:MAG: hypothetical protein DHS20C01_07710 [marine bacterium B5-7]|nr:MAG: hypothetical protein DHS20C01_07710 [marine bacterium B5-7]